MNHNTKTKFQGAAVALAVAGLMGCSAVATESSSKTAAANSNTAEMAHCYGVNKSVSYTHLTLPTKRIV